MVARLSPLASANFPTLQPLLPSGGLVHANAMTETFSSGVTRGGLPLRGRSLRPSRRLSKNLLCHFKLLLIPKPDSRQISFQGNPSAANKTVLARRTNRCSVLPDRTHIFSVITSSPVNSIFFLGLPMA